MILHRDNCNTLEQDAARLRKALQLAQPELFWLDRQTQAKGMKQGASVRAAIEAVKQALSTTRPAPERGKRERGVDPEHTCTFVEEQEPSGRLIVGPCLDCGASAFDALKELNALQ
jgi:hypothetical protein